VAGNEGGSSGLGKVLEAGERATLLYLDCYQIGIIGMPGILKIDWKIQRDGRRETEDM
jgi:hypothetical protein